MAHDEHEGSTGIHRDPSDEDPSGWREWMRMAHASCFMDEGCSHTYEDGPHEAHDGWAWDGMGKWRSAFTGNIWMGMGMDGMGCIASIFGLCGPIMWDG